MISDPIGDMLSRIRNGFLASRREVTVPYSKVKENLAEILLRNGYFKKVEIVGENKKSFKFTLRYEAKKPTLTKIERVSKPGRRVYIKAGQIRPVLSGLGMMVLSTPMGLMTGRQAQKKNLGGEIICRIW
ncbi:MAG TPA: 30S ribosomal protein S8 [Candidatus Bathyarchaeia archaeon]|nr:30S ribosomal protein S8 [Candidatus Bathyarchaeia archaeon]